MLLREIGDLPFPEVFKNRLTSVWTGYWWEDLIRHCLEEPCPLVNLPLYCRLHNFKAPGKVKTSLSLYYKIISIALSKAKVGNWIIQNKSYSLICNISSQILRKQEGMKLMFFTRKVKIRQCRESCGFSFLFLLKHYLIYLSFEGTWTSDPPVSTSRELELKLCTTTSGFMWQCGTKPKAPCILGEHSTIWAPSQHHRVQFLILTE